MQICYLQYLKLRNMVPEGIAKDVVAVLKYELMLVRSLRGRARRAGLTARKRAEGMRGKAEGKKRADGKGTNHA